MVSIRRTPGVPAQLALVLLSIAIAWIASRFWLYPLLGIPDYAPMILRPVTGFLMAWLLLRLLQEPWSALGLRRPIGWARFAAGSAVLYLSMWLTSTFVIPPLAQWLEFTGGPSILGYISGNSVALFGWLHLYQGTFGFLFAFTFAILSGLGYLLIGRNLWPLIVAHGMWNSIAMVGIYRS